MARMETVKLFVLRIASSGNGYLIRVQDLRTGEVREFNSWAALKRYAEKEALHARLH